ncbi:MAG: DUF2877 domain-containing protein [Pseudomonadota bacterium]|nr:DUF2877 domain-containing protein [Pseudomonadota bacterium]
MQLIAEVVGRFAQEALALGEGKVCALFRRSFYLRLPGERYACIGDASLGRGPLNALVIDFHEIAIGEKVSVSTANSTLWQPPPALNALSTDLEGLRSAAAGRIPLEGLGGLIVGAHNPLCVHAQPALEAIDRWLVGNALSNEIEQLVGLGPGLTPSGDDYLGGVLIALHHLARRPQAQTLWRWLEPRLAQRTSAISAAHLAAAAAGQGHEALHGCLAVLFQKNNQWSPALDSLSRVGHCSGWDALAGAAAVARSFA